MKRKPITFDEWNDAVVLRNVWCSFGQHGSWHPIGLDYLATHNLEHAARVGDPGWHEAYWLICPFDPNNKFHVAGYLASRSDEA